jgi:hypothetical protein
VSVTDLRTALETIVEASTCSGRYRAKERISLALPDGDVGAIDDAKFVDWLIANAEPAPYGQGTVTKIDPKVRSAKRLTARDKVLVAGFEPESVLDKIEVALSPSVKLSAKLTDVIVYKKGDKFTRHKDTPRSADLIGTLIVGLPIAHTGGAFVVDDGQKAQTFDWGEPEDGYLPWVALFSDIDHEIKPVKSGARITLVYSLHRTKQPRTDPGAKQRKQLADAIAASLKNQKDWPVMIACNRQVIAEPGAKQPQKLDALRGADRDIAEALVAAGFRVDVRACMAAIANYDDPSPWPATNNLWSITRLKTVPPFEVFDHMADDGGAIEEYILDSVPIDRCAVRASASATLIQESGMWAEHGMDFGNEGYDALLYTLAALEISKPKKKS